MATARITDSIRLEVRSLVKDAASNRDIVRAHALANQLRRRGIIDAVSEHDLFQIIVQEAERADVTVEFDGHGAAKHAQGE